MPLTARCHSLRPERSSGWLAFFELVPRGGRAAHFLVVGPADNADRAAHEVALRSAQAAVRYLKEVPGQAPASTVLDAVERLITHEAAQAGSDIEFGCAVLERDRLCTVTRGRVRLLQLGEERGYPFAPSESNEVAVSEGERYYFGPLPRGAGNEAVSQDFLARLEHGGGGDGGLVITLTGSGEASRLDLAPTGASRRDRDETGEFAPGAGPPAEKTPREEPVAEIGAAEALSREQGPSPEPEATDDEDSPRRHEWKTVELPPRPETLSGGKTARKHETLPMWEEVNLPDSGAAPRPAEAGEEDAEHGVQEDAPARDRESAPAEPAAEPEPPREPEPPAGEFETAPPEPVPSPGEPAAEPFSDLVSELRDVFADSEDAGGVSAGEEERDVQDVEEGYEPGDLPRSGRLPDDEALSFDAPEEDLSVRDLPDEDLVDEDVEGDDAEPVGEPDEDTPAGEAPPAAAPPGAGPEGGRTPDEPAGRKTPPADRDLYAPEETRGLGFWLAVVAAIIALGALVVYLALVRPRLGGERAAEDTATPAAPAAETEETDVLGPVEPTLQWSQSFEGAVTSSPLLAGEMVVFGCRDGRVYALDRATGRREWAYAAPDGFGSSPARAGDLVVIGGYDGRLYALDAATGEERWNHDLGGRIVASPAVDDASAYVGAYNKVFQAISLADGSLRWSRDLGAVQWASPAISDEVVVTAGLDGTVTALDRADGRILWQARTGGEIYSSPVIAERKVIVGSQDGALHAFDLASGEGVWEVDAGSAVDGSPGYHEGRVVVGTNEGLILGVDVGLGRIVWRVATGGEVKSRPAFRDRLAWLTGYDGFLHGVEWLTGAEAARYPIDSSAYSSPAVGDGTAYFGTMDGRFLAVHLGGAAP